MDDDIDYGELFGVSLEGGGAEPDKEPEQRDADPAGEPEPAPDGEGESNGGTELDAPGAGTSQQDGESPQQPAGGTAPKAQFSARPSAQTPSPAPDEAAVGAKAEAQRIIDETFARSGLRNPYTGQPITSKAEYDAYLERFSAEQMDQVLKKTGMSGEQFQQFVQNLPEVRKAREAQAAAEQTVREAREAAAKVKVDEQIREIGTLDPSIKSLEDLAKMPTYPQFTFEDLTEEQKGMLRAAALGRPGTVIPSQGWVQGEEALDEDGWYLDLADSQIRQSMTAVLFLHPQSMDAAKNCGLSAVNQTGDGVLRLYAAAPPEEELTADLVLLACEGQDDGLPPVAEPEEVQELLTEIFGQEEPEPAPDDPGIAGPEEVRDMLEDVFGREEPEPDIAGAEEVRNMLADVFETL